MSILDDFLSVMESVKHQDVEQILGVILAKARRHTMAEAGSIFIVRQTPNEPDELVACSLQNDRVQVESEMFTMPINTKSIAGYVASTGEVVEIDDLYELPQGVPYTFNRSFDDRDGYRSASMLAVPLKNYHGDVIGVVQLLNHMSGVDASGNPNYQPFSIEYIDDMKSVMTVLGAIVERESLIKEIQDLKAKLSHYEQDGTREAV